MRLQTFIQVLQQHLLAVAEANGVAVLEHFERELCENHILAGSHVVAGLQVFRDVIQM